MHGCCPATASACDVPVRPVCRGCSERSGGSGHTHSMPSLCVVRVWTGGRRSGDASRAQLAPHVQFSELQSSLELCDSWGRGVRGPAPRVEFTSCVCFWFFFKSDSRGLVCRSKKMHMSQSPVPTSSGHGTIFQFSPPPTPHPPPATASALQRAMLSAT
jgi:hypothetical protein